LTPEYAAPELSLGRAPTTASDIYSLGATLLFAATGRTPRAGVARSATDAGGTALGESLTAMLETDPRKRIRSARLVAAQLGADLPEAPGQAWISSGRPGDAGSWTAAADHSASDEALDLRHVPRRRVREAAILSTMALAAAAAAFLAVWWLTRGG
jgi:serine/threonine protein kinase